MLRGGAGNDELHAGQGRDVVAGDDGDDNLLPGSGDDFVIGGSGSDIARFGVSLASASLNVEGNWVRVDGEGSDPVYRDVETLRFTDGEVAMSSLVTWPAPTPALGESGRVVVRQDGPDKWTQVAFSQPITDAAVVMGPPGYAGYHPSTLQIRNVPEAGFEFQLDEWDYLDGWHAPETVSWLAVSQGAHALKDGRVISAGLTEGNHQFSEVSFGRDFGASPVVLAQAPSANGPVGVATRVRNVDADSFGFALQEEQGADCWHTKESVGWIAVEAGLGPAGGISAGVQDGIGSAGGALDYGGAFASDPALLAGLQSYYGADPAALRATASMASGAEVFVEE